MDAGLGKVISTGTITLIEPTVIIDTTPTEMDIDGVKVVFQNTPDTEAPAEMQFFFPQFRALCMAENCSHNLHNLYTLRGAQVRDARTGPTTSTRPSNSSRGKPTWSSPATTGRCGGTTAAWNSLKNSATCTSTCTTRS